MFLKEKLAEDKLINSMEIVLVCHVADSLQEKTIFLTEKKKLTVLRLTKIANTTTVKWSQNVVIASKVPQLMSTKK